MKQIRRTFFPAGLLVLWLGFAPLASLAATYTVTTTNDSGAGSFRQAILNANGAAGADLIAFNLPGAGPFTISVQSALPAITNSVTIDATSQPGYAGTPIVELNGASAGTNANGLYLTGGNSVVRGLIIDQFAGVGVGLDGAGGNLIQGNYIGTDVSGTLNRGNAGAGIYIGTASGNVIGGATAAQGNLIAFNGGAGVAIVSGSNNLVRANAILMNTGLAIDLGTAGNRLQAAPTLTEVTASGMGTLIHGRLNSAPNSTFQIDFYASPTVNATGAGEGRTYLGSTNITTDAQGQTGFAVAFAVALPVGSFLSATATDPSNNTSAFSDGLKFTPVNPVALSVAVSASTNAAVLGDQVFYSITVTNSSTNTASGVTVTDWLPAAMNYVYAVASQGTPIAASNSVILNLGILAPGASATMQVYVSSTVPGICTNVVAVSENEYNLSALTATGIAVVNVYQPAPPTVTKQPTPQLLNLGGLLNLVVNVLGPPETKYQWRLNGANIPGATNSTYSRQSLLASDCGTYTAVVSDDYGATISQEAVISLGGLINLPGPDNFAQRAPLLNLLGLVSYNNVNATSEPGEPMHAGIPGGKSVWFTWTPLLSGVATFDTFGSSFDTLLAVYTGNQLTNLTEVASSDDGDPYYRSRVVFNAVGGTTYSIAVDGAYGASGIILLNTSEAILASAVPRITAQPINQIVGLGSIATFSIPTVSGGSYQWYRNDVSLPGATSATLQVTNVSAANVGLYRVRVSAGGQTAISKSASLQISLLDGLVDVNTLAEDKFQAVGYLISTPLGLQQTTQTPQTKSAMQIASRSGMRTGGGNSRGYSSTQIFSTYGSGTQSGEPFNCDQPGGSSAWTSVQAVNNGVMQIDTDGSNFATELGVYTGNGNDFSSLVPVACDVSSGTGGTNSMVTFAATSNTVYYVSVDGVNGAYGTAVLNANLSVPPTIGSQPASHTVSSGSTVVLTASVSGYPTPQCQWWWNGSLMTGQTNGTLTLTNIQTCSCGNYHMTAANNVGSAATTPAAILLNGPMHLDQCGLSLTNHAFQMRLVGFANTNYVILASTNMTTWVPIATNASGTGLWTFTDTNASRFPGRYYRAKPQ